MARLDGEDPDAVPTRPLPESSPGSASASAETPTEQFAPHVPVADVATAPMDPVVAPATTRPQRAMWPWVLLAVVLLGAIVAIVVGMNLDTGNQPLAPASSSPTPSVTTTGPVPAPDATVPETPDQTPDEPPPTQEPTTPPPSDPTPEPTGTTSP
jgi:hypothetical protein